MTFLLSDSNFLEHLIEHNLCEVKELKISQIESKSCKNFNLLVVFSNNHHLLIKQERHNKEGKTHGEFLQEWRIHEWLQNFQELSEFRAIISEALHFDPIRSIIIFNYLNEYCDLEDFYDNEHIFPQEIAASLGTSVATIHRKTWKCQKYKEFLAKDSQDISKHPNFLRGLERIKPEIFAHISLENLKFFKLYQRHDRLRQAIAQLQTAYQSCCLIHNDLKLNNILLHNQWKQSPNQAIVRLIDWEKFAWGDPALDLGTIIASYLNIWLGSLVISTDIDLQTALRLAGTPLDQIQPSIFSLIKAYLTHFPEILKLRPNFLQLVMQFTGLALVEKIQIKIDYHEAFGNIGICMLQVANTLLCHPDKSIPIILGHSASELNF
ncbi:MAG: phosphotransferase [Aulosira sp. ZfuVER01]|nr:aminoglycoside phosphotransferase family protein [Aulosira sp. ZfuVER01]MDZ8001229.1 aminoglycoside phosphotransferase family protein [Aulosira sp. DedVER01a]MDZ8050886.1 aminoglycoside phosphotransferase family protein [Aulosira sp. ZfuCHP01]